MKTLNIIAIIIMAVLTLNNISNAQPRQPENRPMQHPQKSPKPDFTKLDLTPVQEEKINALETNHEEIMKSIHTKMQSINQAIQNVRRQPEIDELKFKELYNELCTVRAEADLQRELFHRELKSILTEKQWEEFKKMRPFKPVQHF